MRRFRIGRSSTVPPRHESRQGIPASNGIAIGRAYVVDVSRLKVPKRNIDEDDVENEVERFEQAVAQGDQQFESIKQRIKEKSNDHYDIISAHQLILHDEHLVAETIRRIRRDRLNAEWALRESVDEVRATFEMIEDDYFRERMSDVEFVCERVMRNLLGVEFKVRPPPDAIVVAHDLGPADTAQMHKSAVAGLATEMGGKTSHTAIIARGHEIPCVVGLEDITQVVGNGDLVIIDGSEGLVIVDPPPQIVASYRERARLEAAAGVALLANREIPAETPDHVRIKLFANIDHIDEIPSAFAQGAEGIGLFRTEYPFFASKGIPTEEDHYQYARATIEMAAGKPVTLRTIDVGADKISRHFREFEAEPNPALGLRSIRLCLTEKGLPVFRDQLRGLLRASVHGTIRLMFPMISGVGELRAAMAVLTEVKQQLRSENIDYDPDIPLGIMIEMPSAVMVADHLASMVDFFSIGTNDLIQFTMAVDRVNEHVSYLYEPMHPGLLRLIDRAVAAANGAGIDVSLCGEMAGDIDVAPLLIGLGLKSLSMHAFAIPEIKSLVLTTPHEELANLARRALLMSSGPEVCDLLASYRSQRSDKRG